MHDVVDPGNCARRWLKLKTAVPQNEKQRSNVSCGSLVPSQRGSFPVLLPLRQRICPRPAFGPSLILILTRRHQPLSALWHGVRFSSVVQPRASLAGLPLLFKRTLDALKFGVLLGGSFGVDLLCDEAFHVLGCKSFLSPPLCASLRSVCPSTGTLLPGCSAAPAGLRPESLPKLQCLHVQPNDSVNQPAPTMVTWPCFAATWFEMAKVP